MEPDLSRHWTYFIEFFMLPPAAILLVVFAVYHSPIAFVAIAFAVGLVVWTLLEYWIHRVALHHVEYFAAQHDVHHKYPKAYIGVSTMGVSITYLLVWFALSFAVGYSLAGALVAGIMVSYLTYICIHHRMHHGDRNTFGPMLNNLWDHHAAHHRGGEYNFGVSTTFWDRVFHTLRP